jgi:hypothetical protein
MTRRGEARSLPAWVIGLLRVPLVGKIAGANAIIVTAALLVALHGGADGQATRLWLVLLVSLGLGLVVNATLVIIALRPLNELEHGTPRLAR